MCKILMDYATKRDMNTLEGILMKVMDELSIFWQWFKSM